MNVDGQVIRYDDLLKESLKTIAPANEDRCTIEVNNGRTPNKKSAS